MERLFVSLYYRLFYFIVLDEGGLHLLKAKGGGKETQELSNSSQSNLSVIFEHSARADP